MRTIRPSSEDEMVAVFLRGELDSTRFGPTVTSALRQAGADEALVREANLGDEAANELRRRVLGRARGYEEREGVFGGFPRDAGWEWVALTRTELATVRYIDYDYWVELSGGTRLVTDGAARVEAGVDVFGVSSEGFREAAAALADASGMPPSIIATAWGDAPLVVLEGHVRLTVLALRPDAIPDELVVLLGTSPHMHDWALY